MTNEEFDKELELALDYSTEPWADIVCVSSAFVQHVATLGAQLAAVTAERDRLKAQLDSVPVGAIEVLRKEAIDLYWEQQALNSDGPDGKHLAAIDVWLETQVTP